MTSVHVAAETLVIIVSLAVVTEALPLDSIFARGDSSISILWTPDSINTRPFWYARCCPSDTRYVKCDFLPGVTYRGEAYSYGGEDPWTLFRDRVARGALVGSHDCHYVTCGDPSDSVTGTDCSGFVCYLWGVPRVSTTVLATSAAYMTIAKTELRPGDILVKSGSHAVMVVETDNYPELVIWESYGWPVNGCRERVIDLSNTLWDSYIARRNPGLTGTATCSPYSWVGGESSRRMRSQEVYTLDGRQVAVSSTAANRIQVVVERLSARSGSLAYLILSVRGMPGTR